MTETTQNGTETKPEIKPETKAQITITAKAADAIQKQLAKRGTPEAALRLGIKGGGCSGFSYVIEFHDGEPRARPRVRRAHDGREDGSRRDRPEEPRVPRGDGARLGADAHAAGLQVQQPEREDVLWLRP